jgi:hypothetical protein
LTLNLTLSNNIFMNLHDYIKYERKIDLRTAAEELRIPSHILSKLINGNQVLTETKALEVVAWSNKQVDLHTLITTPLFKF